MIPDRAGNVSQWDVDTLTVILLRQFKRLLMQKGVELKDAEMQHMGEDVAAYRPMNEDAIQARNAMYDLVLQSLEVLDQWGLSYHKSLRTEMNELKWESTADFLALANEKVNAEIRISAGAALMILLGDLRHAIYAVQAVEYDLEALGALDVDAMIAKRALTHHCKIATDAEDWLAQIRATLAL